MKATKFLSAIMLTAMVAFAACNNGPEVPNGPGTTDTTDTTQVVDTTQVSGYLTVAQAIAKQDGSEATVKGYIVGWYNVKPNPGVCVFSAEAAEDTTVNKANILIADAASETNSANVLCVQLPGGAVRSLVNLGENPTNLGKELIIKGTLTKYNTLPGLKAASYAEIDGKKSTDPQAELLCYRTKAGSLASEASNLKIGDIVVLKSVLINFKGTYETSHGYLTSINGTIPADAINATQAIAIAKELQETTDPKNDPHPSDSVFVTGTITQITEAYSTQFKNMTFKIKD